MEKTSRIRSAGFLLFQKRLCGCAASLTMTDPAGLQPQKDKKELLQNEMQQP